MASGSATLSHAARRAGIATALLMLATPVAAHGGAPDLTVRPMARPDPLAEASEARRDQAKARREFERERREDWMDRQFGATYDEWLRERQETERTLNEQLRDDRLERQRPRRKPEDDRLNERLEEKWNRQRELMERPDTRGLRPDTLGHGRLLPRR